MENYSRTAMFIPFSEYIQKIGTPESISTPNSKEGGGKPKCVAGNVYPDLGSQSSYINLDLTKAKEEISETVKDLFQSIGDEAIGITIESIYDFASNYLDTKDKDPREDSGFTWEELSGLEDGIYYRKEVAKTLLSLYDKHKRIRNLEQNIELTKQGVLL